MTTSRANVVGHDHIEITIQITFLPGFPLGYAPFFLSKKGVHVLVVDNILPGLHFTSFVIRQSTIKSMDNTHSKKAH